MGEPYSGVATLVDPDGFTLTWAYTGHSQGKETDYKFK